MARAKHVSEVKRSANAVTVLGIAGAASLAASGSGSAAMIMMDPASFGAGNPDQAYALNDEEISDVSLATFHFFDKDKEVGTLPSGVLLARGCGCGHGCGGGGCGGRGCGGRGCGGRGCGGRGCGGFGGRGCGWGGCGGCAWGWGGYYGGCCLSWGGCYYC